MCSALGQALEEGGLRRVGKRRLKLEDVLDGTTKDGVIRAGVELSWGRHGHQRLCDALKRVVIHLRGRTSGLHGLPSGDEHRRGRDNVAELAAHFAKTRRVHEKGLGAGAIVRVADHVGKLSGRGENRIIGGLLHDERKEGRVVQFDVGCRPLLSQKVGVLD
jgi:hypothetical protein